MATAYVIDVTPEYWWRANPISLTQLLDSILSSARMSKLQSQSTVPVGIIAAYPDRCEYLLNGSLTLKSVQRAYANICSALESRRVNGLSGESLIGQGLSMGVCFINKHIKLGKGRVVVFETSQNASDFAKQAVEISNTGFAVESSHIGQIDVISFGSTPAAVLQQLSVKTSGVQIPRSLTESPGRLLEALLFHINCPAEGLTKVRKQANETMAIGAVCCCHANSIEKGYVCSVCLSVYCTESANACQLCGSRMRREDRESLPLSLQSFQHLL